MRRAVLLHHRLPSEAESHFDWLIEQFEGDDPQERALAAFRLASSEAVLEVGSFSAIRIPDHRRLYLDFEGDVSRGRGAVVRVSSGRVISADLGDEQIKAVVDWGSSTLAYEGQQVGADGEWRFMVSADR